MAYRIKLNCIDRVRFAEASNDMRLDGSDLVKALYRSFFERMGVKNPPVMMRTKDASLCRQGVKNRSRAKVKSCRF